MKILQNSDGKFCEIYSAIDQGIIHILVYWHSNEQHKTLKCYEKLFVCLFPKQKLVLSLSSFPPPQFHMCTWQLSIAIRWLWNNTGQDSKANKQGTGCRRLKLSLRVIFKGIIFSFPYASRLCCSHYLSEWQPHIQICYSYMNCIGSSSGSIQEARWDAKI